MLVKKLGKAAGWSCRKVIDVGLSTIIAFTIRKLLLKV